MYSASGSAILKLVADYHHRGLALLLYLVLLPAAAARSRTFQDGRRHQQQQP